DFKITVLPNGKLDGIFETCYENSNNKCIFCEYNNGKMDGKYYHWRTNGELWIECTYKNDKLEGTYSEYTRKIYHNQRILIKKMYKNGELKYSSMEWS